MQGLTSDSPWEMKSKSVKIGREYRFRISKGRFSWIGGVRWVEWGWKGCNIGDGEEETNLLPPILQVTRETLSSRAGATVIYSNSNFSSNWRPRCDTWSGIWLTNFVCNQDGGPPLDSALNMRSWRGGEQPGRWSPGGWRRCGGRGPNSSTSRLRFEAYLHLGDVRDIWPEAKDFAFLAKCQELHLLFVEL